MKSKLSYYPYNRPQYEWEKKELEERFNEVYKTYDCEEYTDNAYYKAIKGDLTGKQFVKGRTVHEGDITGYEPHYNADNPTIGGTKAYYVKPQKRKITYSLDLDDKKDLYDYYGLDGVKDFPTELKLYYENIHDSTSRLDITLLNTKFYCLRYDNTIKDITVYGGINYTGIEARDFRGNITELDDIFIKEINDITVNWIIQYDNQYKLHYYIDIPKYRHGGTPIKLLSTDKYDIEDKGNSIYYLIPPFKKRKIFIGNIEYGVLHDAMELSLLEKCNFCDAKELLDAGYKSFDNQSFDFGDNKVPYALIHSGPSFIFIMKSDKQFNSHDFEPGYTLDEIAMRRGIVQIENADTIPLDPNKNYHQYITEGYVVPQYSKEVILSNPTIDEIKKGGIWKDNKFYASTRNMFEEAQSLTYHEKEKIGPYKWNTLDFIDLDRSKDFIYSDVQIANILALAAMSP